MLGGDDRRLLELVDGLGVPRPHRQHAGEAGADDDLHLGFGPSGEHAAGHRLGVSQPTGRQQRLDQLGGERIARSDRSGSVISSARSSSRTAVAGARAAATCAARRSHSTASASPCSAPSTT